MSLRTFLMPIRFSASFIEEQDEGKVRLTGVQDSRVQGTNKTDH